jgi:excisionase family DNA binding protein
MAILLKGPTEAAEMLGIGRTTVYSLIKAGDLHPIKIGTRTLISMDELEAYVDRLKAGAT